MLLNNEQWHISDDLSSFSYVNNPEPLLKASWECAMNEISCTQNTVALLKKNEKSDVNVFISHSTTFNFYYDYIFTLDVYAPEKAKTFCLRLTTKDGEQFTSHCTATHSNKWCRLTFELPSACRKIITEIHLHVHWIEESFDVYFANFKTPNIYPNFVFLVTGQSNAQGGYAVQEDCAEDSVSDNIKAWSVEHNAWITANLEENFGTKYANIQNFGFHCAKELTSLYPDIIPGIVCCAMSGMPIRRWCKANIPSYITPLEIGWYWYIYDGDIYDASKIMLEASLAGTNCKCSMILWSQGQADAYHSTEFYRYALNNVIMQYNEDFDTPIFIASELPYYGANFHNTVLNELNNDGNERTRCIPVGDIDQMDSWHFSSYGLRELGKRFAGEYQKLVNYRSDYGTN